MINVLDDSLVFTLFENLSYSWETETRWFNFFSKIQYIYLSRGEHEFMSNITVHLHNNDNCLLFKTISNIVSVIAFNCHSENLKNSNLILGVEDW